MRNFLADAYFLDDKYELAAETYKDFDRCIPVNEAIPMFCTSTRCRA